MTAADDSLEFFFHLFFSGKIRLDISSAVILLGCLRVRHYSKLHGYSMQPISCGTARNICIIKKKDNLISNHLISCCKWNASQKYGSSLQQHKGTTMDPDLGYGLGYL